MFLLIFLIKDLMNFSSKKLTGPSAAQHNDYDIKQQTAPEKPARSVVRKRGCKVEDPAQAYLPASE